MSNSKTYKIITFGCQMNEHDSEVISGMLAQRGYTEFAGDDAGARATVKSGASAESGTTAGAGASAKSGTTDRASATVESDASAELSVTAKTGATVPVSGHAKATKHEPTSDPDIMIINTCSIRENADKRFFGTLGQLKKIKARKPDFVVCVCGCMMQQDHITTKMRRSYPWVDIIFGTHNIHELPDMLEELYANRASKHEVNSRSSKGTRVDRVYEDATDIVEGLPAKRLFGHKSFVNIMYGCNNFCTYCIVPYTRGREKSRTPEDIINEVKTLVADGVKEVTLLGQNVNSYRGRDWDFTDLIYALAEIDGLERIRFMTSHPKDLSDKLIEAFAKCGKLCNYVHLPVQAGSTEVLSRMNRKYTRESYLELVDKLREAVPGIAISTDIIVGFPGETEENFRDTLSLAETVQYDSAFTFLYSPRQGTPAAGYENQIPEAVKHERFNRLVDIMNAGSAEKNATFIGRTCKVLVDGPSKKDGACDGEIIILNGRTEEFKLVDFAGPRDLIGQIVDVKITDSNTFSLKGEIVSASRTK